MPPRNIAAACAAFHGCRRADPSAAGTLRGGALRSPHPNDGDDTAFLLTKRASHLRAHRGQWALPGGRCDAGETPVAGGAARAPTRNSALGLPSDAPCSACSTIIRRAPAHPITPVVVGPRDNDTINCPTRTRSPPSIASRSITIERDDAFHFTAIPQSTPSRHPLSSPTA